MSIISGVCDTFKQECMLGVHDLSTDVLKMALYDQTADINPLTPTYTDAGEIVGSGYDAGGIVLENVSVNLSGSVAVLDFDDPFWPVTTLSARGCMIYNSSKENKAIAVYDFGENKVTSNAAFLIGIPTGDAANAIVRLA